jgi:hypothetical protein
MQGSEESMFVTISRYSPKNGAINKASLELLRRQIQNEFLPLAQNIRGFRGYYVVSVDDRELMTLSLYKTPEGRAEFAERVGEYTLRNPLIFELGRPEVTEGEVLTFAAALFEIEPQEMNGGEAAPVPALWSDQSRGMLLPASER